jgi:hypothetical protein
LNLLRNDGPQGSIPDKQQYSVGHGIDDGTKCPKEAVMVLACPKAAHVDHHRRALYQAQLPSVFFDTFS